MNKSIDEWAMVLVQALPYFKLWCGKTIVIKYGGNAMLNEALRKAVTKDIVLLHTIGVKVVLVHGGGPEINKMLSRLNIESKFINGLRYTDKETMDIVEMCLAGKVNKDIVSMILQEGGKAVGISGIDSGLLLASKVKESDLGLVGEIKEVQPNIVNSLLENDYIPVISTVALKADADFNGEETYCYNINADTAASMIAIALKAEKLIQLTNVPGVLKTPEDTSSLIHRIKVSDVNSLIESGVIDGGMIPKVKCCASAVEEGVKRTHIIDGRVPHSLLIEMFSDQGIGTMIY